MTECVCCEHEAKCNEEGMCQVCVAAVEGAKEILARAPRRLQHKRTKGWRKPPGSVYVGRPGPWGNPFRIGLVYDGLRRVAFNGLTLTWRKDAVAMFREWVHLPAQSELVARARRELRGKDLLCWCPEGTACHGDVWLEVANAPTCTNHPDRPVCSPSKVLCSECLDELDKKMHALLEVNHG